MQTKNNDGKSAHQEDAGHAAEADQAKYHLRNDKDLNRAYPLNEKNPAPKSSPKGE